MAAVCSMVSINSIMASARRTCSSRHYKVTVYFINGTANAVDAGGGELCQPAWSALPEGVSAQYHSTGLLD